MVTATDAQSNASENQHTTDGEHKVRHGPDGKLTYQAVTNFLSSSSDLASSTSFFDDDETENDMDKMKHENYYDYDENLTEYSSILSSQQNNRLRIRKKPQKRKKRPNQQMSRTSSYSSITDSTMSLNIITVTLNMDTVNFLGMTILSLLLFNVKFIDLNLSSSTCFFYPLFKLFLLYLFLFYIF